jgi:hypothetical protein
VGVVVVIGLVTALVEVVVVMETCAEVVVVAGFDEVVVVVELLQDASIKADTIKILKPNQITLFFISPPS